MKYFKSFKRGVQLHLGLILLINNLLLVAVYIVGAQLLDLSSSMLAIILAATALLLMLIITFVSTNYLSKPMDTIGRAINYVSPDKSDYAAPVLDDIRLGRELVTELSREVYSIASSAKISPLISSAPNENVLMNSLSIPIVMMDKSQKITFINTAASKFIGKAATEIINKNMYDVFDFSFSSDDTYDSWLNQTRTNSAVASKSWSHVRLPLADPIGLKQIDMTASYSLDSANGTEITLTLYDRTLDYSKDDESISFVAIAVHELRNPVTLLRGYIDVFEEELSGKLNVELADFMIKMQVAAGQLSTFINNILNVSRVENDKLSLELSEQKWPDIIQGAINGISMRAKVHNKTIEFVAPNNLPTVGVDSVSIYEVLSNLLDNAIKYSGDNAGKIVVSTLLTKDGLVETKIQDFGVGISSNVLPKLFEKFYRNHRTQTSVGGTGLGLYLSKAIVNAHGGNVWVDSKEGQGSTFGFTVLPYVMVANKLKPGNNGITRNAHGWIKNHSLYRR